MKWQQRQNQMISFKEYLGEAIIKKWDQKKAGTEEAIALLNKYCRGGLRAIDNKSIIWRGIESNKLKEFGIMDSSTGLRTSKDTSNLYQAMMDASSALKGFPSRSKSFICSTSYKSASSYTSKYGYDVKQNVYAFIPFDGTDIAISATGDMFGVEIKHPWTKDFMGVDSFNNSFQYWLSSNFKIRSDEGGQFLNLKNIDAKLAKVSDKKFKDAIYIANWSRISDSSMDTVFMELNKDPSKRMTTIASIILTPETLKLKLIKFGDKMPGSREVWFSGKAVAIRADVMENIMAIIKKEKKEGVREAVNDKVFFTDFKKEKDILDGAYKLVASAGYVGYGAKPGFKSDQFRIVAKTAKGAEIGWVNFEKHEDHLEALDLSIQPAHRRKGIATEMYKLARECGNTVAPSKLQTGMGKTFWNKDHSK
jgi:hypothetical protein